MEVVSNVLLPASVFLLMLAMGLSLESAHFATVFKRSRAVITGLLSILVVLPILGLTIAALSPVPQALAVGIVLVAACPGGTFSNLLTHYGGGDVALSISLTALTSLCAVFTIPLYVHYALVAFAGHAQAVPLPIVPTIAKIFVLTALPVAVGMLLRVRYRGFAERWHAHLKNFAAIAMVTLFVIIIIDQRSVLLTALGLVALPVVVLNAASLLAGFAVSRWRHLAAAQTIAVTLEHTIKQEGTGIFVAITVLAAPVMVFPLLINSVIGMVFGVALTVAIRRGWLRRWVPAPSA